MKIGIIAAMEQELVLLVEQLENKVEETVLGNTYYTGRLGKHDVVLVQSGVGKVMSAMSVAVLADHFGVDALINTGSAGAVAPGLKIGDVVVASKLAYHDVDLTAFGYDYGQMSMQPLYFESDSTFVETFEKVLAQASIDSKIGLIATGDSFIAGQDKIDAIKGHFPEVLAVEMEGAAIAQAAHSVKKPFIVVRAMSDTAAHDANITFDEFIIQAGKQSAAILVEFLKELKAGSRIIETTSAANSDTNYTQATYVKSNNDGFTLVYVYDADWSKWEKENKALMLMATRQSVALLLGFKNTATFNNLFDSIVTEMIEE